MKQILPIIFLTIIASSCVSNPEESSIAMNSNEEESDLICRQEKVLGSKIPETFCYTREELDSMEEGGRNAFEKERRERLNQQTQEGLRNIDPT